jgi:hypothetical protein
VNNIFMGTGTLSLYAPRGSDGTSGAWSQTTGSPYLFYVSGTKGYSLPVGTIVTGAGIPAGTFLKRIFSDNSIELSNPSESHPFAPGAASDAFAYDRKGGAYSGCQTLCESIVYTNELTQSERLQVAQYLAQKWCARDIAVNSRFVEQQKLGEYTLTGSSSFVKTPA